MVRRKRLTLNGEKEKAKSTEKYFGTGSEINKDGSLEDELNKSVQQRDSFCYVGSCKYRTEGAAL